MQAPNYQHAKKPRVELTFNGRLICKVKEAPVETPVSSLCCILI
jgi:hypothetical protein